MKSGFGTRRITYWLCYSYGVGMKYAGHWSLPAPSLFCYLSGFRFQLVLYTQFQAYFVASYKCERIVLRKWKLIFSGSWILHSILHFYMVSVLPLNQNGHVAVPIFCVPTQRMRDCQPDSYLLLQSTVLVYQTPLPFPLYFQKTENIRGQSSFTQRRANKLSESTSRQILSHFWHKGTG